MDVNVKLILQKHSHSVYYYL